MQTEMNERIRAATHAFILEAAPVKNPPCLKPRWISFYYQLNSASRTIYMAYSHFLYKFYKYFTAMIS
jgi:hypothetical protein